MIVLHQDKISASSGFKGDPGQVTAAQGNSRVQVRFIVQEWGISIRDIPSHAASISSSTQRYFHLFFCCVFLMELDSFKPSLQMSVAKMSSGICIT